MIMPPIKDQVLIDKLKEIVLENLEIEGFGVRELVRLSGYSHSRLNRKLHASINKTITQFIREIRLRKAFEILKNESLTASEVSYKTGFSSPSYFNRCFHEFFGYPPGKMKNRELDEPVTKSPRNSFRLTNFNHKWRSLFLSIILITIAIVVYPKIIKKARLADLRSSGERISLAVMPFQNFTRDTARNFWSDMIQDNLITSLTNTEELEVRQLATITGILRSKGLEDYASISPSFASSISKKLNANVLIYGSINQAGNLIRLNAQLINPKSREIFHSVQVQGPGEDIMFLMDTLSAMIKNSLIISEMSREANPKTISTRSAEAYRYYLNGIKAKYNDYNPTVAKNWFLQAIAVDSNYFEAVDRLASVAGVDTNKWVLYNYSKRDLMPMRMKLYASWAYAFNFETIDDEIIYLKQLQELDQHETRPTYLLAYAYSRLYQYDKAIAELERSMELYRKWGSIPTEQEVKWLGNAYHKTGQFKKEKKLYRMAEKDLSERPWVIYRQAIFFLSQGNMVAANRYIEKFFSVCNSFSLPEAGVTSLVAQIYNEGGFPDKAEEYYRKAICLEPQNKDIIRDFARFLIDNDRDIEEGLKLASKALEIYPDNYSFLACKGWGLYKIGEYEKALELLQKSWELKELYDYDIYLHMEEVKKAIASNI